jgi:hypothetical protein
MKVAEWVTGVYCRAPSVATGAAFCRIYAGEREVCDQRIKQPARDAEAGIAYGKITCHTMDLSERP